MGVSGEPKKKKEKKEKKGKKRKKKEKRRSSDLNKRLLHNFSQKRVISRSNKGEFYRGGQAFFFGRNSAFLKKNKGAWSAPASPWQHSQRETTRNRQHLINVVYIKNLSDFRGRNTEQAVQLPGIAPSWLAVSSVHESGDPLMHAMDALWCTEQGRMRFCKVPQHMPPSAAGSISNPSGPGATKRSAMRTD